MLHNRGAVVNANESGFIPVGTLGKHKGTDMRVFLVQVRVAYCDWAQKRREGEKVRSNL